MEQDPSDHYITQLNIVILPDRPSPAAPSSDLIIGQQFLPCADGAAANISLGVAQTMWR